MTSTKACQAGFGRNARPWRKSPTESQKLQSSGASFQLNQSTCLRLRRLRAPSR